MKPPIHTGSEETKQFYDRLGWRKQKGEVVDRTLFGVKEDGPIRKYLYWVHTERVRSALKRAGDRIRLLECGCGGTPAINLLDLCSDYTGVDFSSVGLEEANEQIKGAAIPCELRKADVCNLPFDDGQFDAVYSAHMIYHIPDPVAQGTALEEMLRVVKPGGVVALITANPWPLLFPIRLFRRLLANMPLVSDIANLVRHRPLPYRPMALGHIRRHMIQYGPVEFVTHGLPSTAFNQRVTEYGGIGKRLWGLIKWLDVTYPRVSVHLGNYVQVTVVKDPPAANSKRNL